MNLKNNRRIIYAIAAGCQWDIFLLSFYLGVIFLCKKVLRLSFACHHRDHHMKLDQLRKKLFRRNWTSLHILRQLSFWSLWTGLFMLNRRRPFGPLEFSQDIRAQSTLQCASWWWLATEGSEGGAASWHPTPNSCAESELRLHFVHRLGENSWLTANFLRDFMILTIAASISCFLSSSTLLRVSRRSGSVSPLAATVWIFTLQTKWQ